MIYIRYVAEDVDPCTITVDYAYDDKRATLRADPNGSCADESKIRMSIVNVCPSPDMEKWPLLIADFEKGDLHKMAADMALDNYFER